MVNNGNQCAFPTGVEGDPGLTKRELGALMVLQGMLSNPSWSMPIVDSNPKAIRGLCYQYADLILEEPEESEEGESPPQPGG